MNVFYLDTNPRAAAQQHSIAHVNKMIIEYAQQMSTAHHLTSHIGESTTMTLYNIARPYHRSTKWVRHSIESYKWVLECWIELCCIYHSYAGKVHRTVSKASSVTLIPPALESKPWVDPPVAFTQDYRETDQYKWHKHFTTVERYRDYCRFKFYVWRTRTDKKRMNVEFFRTVPGWVHDWLPVDYNSNPYAEIRARSQKTLTLQR